MPVGVPRSSRRTSKTENGRRSSGSMPAARLDHHELARRRRRGNLRRRERQHVVVGRQRAIDITCAATSIGIAAVYSVRNAVFAHAQQLGRGGVRRRPPTCIVLFLNLNPTLPLHPARLVSDRNDRRAVLRAAPHRDFLRRARAAAVARARAVFAGVDQRRRADVAGRGRRGGGRRADVGEPRTFELVLEPDTAASLERARSCW